MDQARWKSGWLTGAICLIALLANRSIVAATPNIVLIYTDDQGYGDLGCYGSTTLDTPHIDKLAAEGVRFTDFYVAQAVCGASRAALLTGCYPNRIGMHGAPSHASRHGINPSETLLSELCKHKGYATGAIGKWHLGHRVESLPLQHGFDSYFGLPYSNDMWPFHPTNRSFPPLPLFKNNLVLDPEVTAEDQTHLTTWYTEHAVRFIEEHKSRPFFLYVAHSMVHVPLFVSDKFKGKSRQGLYGDAMMEIDWSTGQIMETLKKHSLDENTLIIYASDNGPWLSYGNHAGSAGPLREGKGTTWDGGVRVPCVMRWPARIPAGIVCKEPAMTIDLFPTVASILEAPLPTHTIDGKNILPLMTGEPGATSPHEALYFYWANELQAVRKGSWKMHFPHSYRGLTGTPGHDGKPNGYSEQKTGLVLYDMATDPGESNDVSEQNPKVIAEINRLADSIREELGDSAKRLTGKGIRPPQQF